MSTTRDILESRGIDYKMSGRDLVIRCLNPDHEDRNPSLRVDSISGVFNCFSCGFKGSLFKYYNVEVNQVSLKSELLKKKISLLRSSGVGLPMPPNSSPFYRDYRGISKETYAKFEAFYHHASDFSGRINFPIKDSSGRIVAFQGRDESGTLRSKYMTIPVGTKLPLYPIPAPIQGRVILVEGIFDMLNLHDKGLTNAACCFGVNNFNEHKFNLLRIAGASGLDLMFDSDEAGTKAAEKVKKVVGDFPVRTVTLKSGDPADLTGPKVSALRRKLYS